MPLAAPIRGVFRDDWETRARYSEGAGIYRIVPQAVAQPVDDGDLIALLDWASDRSIPLTPRGAGSSVTGSNVGPGVILDLNRLPRRLEVVPESMTARTSANIRWAELAEAAAPYRLRLPPDPSSGPFATLGGMVSTNASGAHSIRYGSMRPWVRELVVMTAAGQRVTLTRGVPAPIAYPAEAFLAQQDIIRARFPRTTKNSAGYALDAWLESRDLVDLFVGAEGTLGIVTEIEWQLAPIPLHRAGMRVQLADLGLLTSAVASIRAFSPSALELLDRTFLDLVETGGVEGGTVRRSDPPPESILLVELEGDDAGELRETVAAVVRSLDGIAGGIEIALSPDEEARVWRLRHAASPIIADLPAGRRSLQVIEDACVPVPAMGEYIAAVRSKAQQAGVPVVIFGHAGDGNIHVNLLPETTRPGWEEAVARLHREITAEVIRLKGTTSGEHGDGRIRSMVLDELYGPEIVRLFHLLKDALDPRGILNPGVKISRTPAPPLRELKVGRDAAPIPPAIAEELRQIERTGDYRRERL